MKTLKIILLEHISKLGKTGDMVSVRPGFFRNFLLPKSKALYASEENIKVYEAKRAELEARDKALFDQAVSVQSKLSDLKIILHSAADEEEKLYGSITPREIATALNAKLAEENIDVTVTPAQCLINDKVKRLGTYDFRVNLHADVSAQLQMVIRNSAKLEELSAAA